MNDSLRPRTAGVLLPLFSIRTETNWGLGEIPDLASFARWAGAAGFGVINFLPVNEITGGETSPYSAATAFALDPVYVGLDACEDFLATGGRAGLADADRTRLDALGASPTVQWSLVRALKRRALDRAFAHFFAHEWASQSARAQELIAFSTRQAAWLDDYALFSVLHDRHQTAWPSWPAQLRDRDAAALGALRGELETPLLFRRWCQWVLDTQWRQARAAARAAGVDLMGDLPFVVSGDSADVWSHQAQFHLDRRAGTPPDAFSADGQDWGLPVYNWKAMADSGFAWMRARARRAADLFGLYRVDHVIGLYRTFYRTNGSDVQGFTPAVPADQIRLGESLLRMLHESGDVVAEDLGLVPDFLRQSLCTLQIPGYRVMRWERDGDSYRDPATWPPLSVATCGTHDIETNADWWDALSLSERTHLLALPGLGHLEPGQAFDARVRDALLHLIYWAPSRLAIVPFQDLFGGRQRINVPGTVSAENWTYRMPTDVASLEKDTSTTLRLAALARLSQREIGSSVRRL